MSRNADIKRIYEETRSELEAIAKNLNISTAKLKKRYFTDCVYTNSSVDDLEDFLSRCKKKPKPKLVDIERLVPILNYAHSTIGQDSIHKHRNEENVEFAYAMCEAIYSRFLCVNTSEPVGCIKTACESLRDLFIAYRRLTEHYGYKAKHAGEVVRVFLDSEVRPFTTKWHQIILSSSYKHLIGKKYIHC